MISCFHPLQSNGMFLKVFVLLTAFPICMWGLVYLVGATGLLIPVPFVLMLNHTLWFVGLVLILRGEGRTLASIGWRLPLDWRSLSCEAAIGIAAGFALAIGAQFITKL